MYLTREANAAMLHQMAGLAPGSTIVVSFLLPPELLDARDRPLLQTSQTGARASGTPFISFFSPEEMLTLAREAGVREPQHVAGSSLAERYFRGRSDGLRPASGEDLLLASI